MQMYFYQKNFRSQRQPNLHLQFFLVTKIIYCNIYNIILYKYILFDYISKIFIVTNLH